MTARDDHPMLVRWLGHAQQVTLEQMDDAIIEALDEIDRLHRLVADRETFMGLVFDEWDKVWDALDRPGHAGGHKALACVEETKRLRADLEEAREQWNRNAGIAMREEARANRLQEQLRREW